MVAFQAYRRPLVEVLEFKYLGRVITYWDDNCREVVGNLRKVRKRWYKMLKISGQEGSYPQTSRNFNKALVQATLIFGAESWMISPCIGRNIGGFLHRVAHRLSKMHLNRTGRVRKFIYR